MRSVSEPQVIPGTNVPTFRELVKAKQTQRSERLHNKFVERMEDNLIKWRPPVTSNQGTVLAINGNHPYQLQINAEEDEISVLGSFSQWFIENSNFFARNEGSLSKSCWKPANKKDSPIEITNAPNSENNNDDNYSFVLPTVTPTSAVTPIVHPSTENHHQVNLEDDSTSTAGPEIATINRQDHKKISLYKLYYNHPIPVNYLDTTNGVNTIERSQPQTQNNQTSNEINNTWYSTCITAFSQCLKEIQ